MKENEYISMARNIEKSRDLVKRNVDFYHAFDIGKKETFDIYPQVPFVSYQLVLGDKLFGRNLWFGRLVNIILFLFAIILGYFLTLKISGRRLYGFWVAGLLASFPLGVFFSRNLQPESGAFFFMILATLFSFKFMEKFRIRYAVGLGIAVGFLLAYKMPFLFGLLPLLLIFPYRQYLPSVNRRRVVLDILTVFLPSTLLLISWFITGQIGLSQSVEGRVDLFAVFNPSYWQRHGLMIANYTLKENYSPLFFASFVAGILAVWLRLRQDKTLFARYLRASSLSLIAYFMVFSDYLDQHSYYQLPFLFFVCLSIVYFWAYVALKLSSRKNVFPQNIVYSLFLTAVFVFSWLPMKRALKADYLKNFYGQDVIGKYIKTKTNPEEKFFINTICQGYGTCVYAERKCGWDNELEKFKAVEQGQKIRYLVVYPYGFMDDLSENMKNYIFSSYSLCYVGFILHGKKLVKQYAVLKKGGKFDPERFFHNNGKPSLAEVYQTITGPVPFFVLEEKQKESDKQ